MCADQAAHLPETVYIQSLTAVSDGAGGSTETIATKATTAGRIGLPNGRELELAAKIQAVNAYVVTLPWNTDLADTDQLQINGKNYRVNHIQRRSQQTALRVLVTEV